jgi:catechol 2,3-dioxygenase-like lactoylglutathione lyase family enzyme
MAFTASPHHVGLSVADLDAEQRWYQLNLGLEEVVERVQLPEPRVRTVVLRLALEVDDLETAFSDLTASGAPPVSPPAPGASPGVRFAYVQDPEGNLLELIQS